MIEQASLIIGNCNWANKEGSLLGYKLIDGKYYPREIDAVRATTATRVNSAGLVELVPYNLFEYSEQFDNAYWTKPQASVVSGQTSPIGTSNAFKLVEDTSTNFHWLLKSGPISSAGTYNLSIFAKPSGRNFIAIGNASFGEFAYFDLSNGTIVSNHPNAVPNIEVAGNGYYRCSVELTVSTLSAAGFFISTNGSTINYTGDGTSGLFIWGAQLVEGSTAKDYQKTETRLNIPRLDYSNGTCPSLLVEPQRTNLLTWSSSFDNAVWIKENATISTNATIAPDGTLTADKLQEDNTTNKHDFYFGGISTNGVITTIGQTYTISIYAKAAERNFMQIALGTGQVSGNPRVNFNLSNGAISAVDSGITATIESAANGFYRCNLVVTAATTFLTMVVQTQTSGTAARFASYLGTTGNGIFTWGAQLEAGNYSTSYIPTTSASVTRNADVISKTGISSLIGQTEGTMFVDVNNAENETQCFISVTTTSVTANHIWLGQNGDDLALYVRSGGTYSIIANNITSVQGRKKIALVYGASLAKIYVNGTQVFNSTAAVIPSSLSQIELNAYNTSSDIGRANYNAAALWKTQLTNDQLQTLTSL
jgi:hypothetical protein